jgi:phosphoglycolate phosphatase-like HAD superfamily hydrolase
MLVLFDVDGTLTRTAGLDAQLFARAFEDTFGAPLPTTDWTEYPAVSDQGIAEEAALRVLARRADPTEIGEMRDRFLVMLVETLGRWSSPLQVPGAAAIVTALREEGRAVAIATGCWEASARAKLAAARIDATGLPLVGSDHEPEREKILASAIEMAGAAIGRDAIVYVGDSPWDVTAARRLGIGFVGVDADKSGLLARTGAFDVLRDFDDGKSVLTALARAQRRVEARSTM